MQCMAMCQTLMKWLHFTSARLPPVMGCTRHALAGQGDLPARSPGMVSRADVAAICCAAISAKEAKNTTFEIVSNAADDVDPNQLNNYFAGLVPGKHDEMK